MEANLAKRKEGIVDLPITEKEASKSDEEKLNLIRKKLNLTMRK